jgi:hypothetical protein
MPAKSCARACSECTAVEHPTARQPTCFQCVGRALGDYEHNHLDRSARSQRAGFDDDEYGIEDVKEDNTISGYRQS